MLLSFERKAMRLRKMIVDWGGWSGQVYFEHRVAEYRAMWRSVAAARGGTFTELAPDLWEIELDGRRARILNHEVELDDPVTLGLAGRKPTVHRLLQQAGLAVPEHAVFSLEQLDVAQRFVAARPRGCVIKPAGGYGGKGVTTQVRHPGEVRRAAVLASLYDAELLVEAQIPGESHRLLVLKGRLVDAVVRRAPRLRGDGSGRVRDLWRAENVRRRQSGDPLLEIGRDCEFTLAAQGLSLDAVPVAGQIFMATSGDAPRKYTEVRTVYTERVTDRICEAVRRDAETAARLVGSDFLGVDIITTDPSRPLPETGGVINEVNTTPALHHHYERGREPFPRVAPAVLDAVLRRREVAAASSLSA
jgi:cyanophycin synthetase